MAIQIGDYLPQFKAIQQDGTAFDTVLLHEKPVVIYFYPKDFTPGCTTQACSFRDAYQDFQDLGAEVIGVSSDSASSHQDFQKKHNRDTLVSICCKSNPYKYRQSYQLKMNPEI